MLKDLSAGIFHHVRTAGRGVPVSHGSLCSGPTKRVTTPKGFLDGGGDMGGRIRSYDWSRTPLGDPAEWPQSLKTALGILLNSGYPMYIAWGERFTQFYNDAYRPILGSTKHPAALGRSTDETFAEIWDFIGPMFRGVMRTATASTFIDQLLPLDRHGYVEECYFTFSYSAIPREDGGVGGVFVTVLETTDRMLRERRLRTLRDLANMSGRSTAAEICADAAELLARNPHDVPFALLYRPEAEEAVLLGHTGVGGTAPALHRLSLSPTAVLGAGSSPARARECSARRCRSPSFRSARRGRSRSAR